MATANSKLKLDYGFDAYGTSNVTGDLVVSGVLTTSSLTLSGGGGGLTLAGDLIPDQDLRSLGNTTYRWNLTGNQATLDGSLDVDGITTLYGTLNANTIATGNTTITGFANVSTSVNSALLTVGTDFSANTTGLFHTGTVNASSFTTSNSSTTGIVRANTTGVYPSSNTVGTALGSTTRRWVINANTGNFSGLVTVSGNTTLSGNATLSGTLQTISGNSNFDSGVLFVDSINNRVGINSTTPLVSLDVVGSANVSQGVNSSSYNVGVDFIANSTGVYHTGGVDASRYTISTFFSANSSFLESVGSANLTSATSSLRIGTVSVNTFANSTVIETGTGNFEVGASVGSNVNLNTTSLVIGNGTFFSSVTDSLLRVSNSTATSNLTPGALTIGQTIVNSSAVSVSTGTYSLSANIGSNVFINTSAIFVGNSTLNTIVNSSLVSVSGSTSTSNVTPAGFFVGTTVVNSSVLTIGTGNFSTGANVGANVNLTTTSLKVGNSTLNSTQTSSLLQVSNSSTTANLTAADLTIGSAIVNSSVLTIGTGNFSTGANVGANTRLTTTNLFLGNATVNTSFSATEIKLNDTALIVNSVGIYHTGTVNAASHTTTGVTANTSGVYPASNTVGTALGSTTQRWVVTANTGSFTGTVSGTVANMSTSVNSALLTVGTSFIANTLGSYHTGVVNAATLSVGTNFIANSTQITLSGVTLSANGGVGSSGQVLTSNGTGVYWVTPASGTSVSIADETALNSTVYPAFATQTTGTVSTLYVSSTKLTYNPSSGAFGASRFSVGSDFIANSTAIVGTGFANIATSVNSALLTVGTSFIANTTGAYHTGTINAASHTVGSGFIANTTAIVGTGYANVTVSVNSALLTVGTSFIANTLGAYHTGVVNAASHVTSGFVANTTAIAPTSNTILLGNSIGRFVLSANTGDFTGTVSGTIANMSTSVNSALLTVGTSFISNTTGAYHTGTVNAASHTVGSSFIANSSTVIAPLQLVVTGGTAAGEGGQIILGYGNNLASSITGQANNTFNLDITGGNTGSTPLLRAFFQNADGSTTAGFNIANTGRMHVGSVAEQTDSTFKVTGTANVTTSVNSALLTVGTSFIANTTGAYHTGTVNAASITIGSNFIANTTQITLSGIPLSANGGTGTGGQVLTSNGTSGAPYWSTFVASVPATYVQNTDSRTLSGNLVISGTYFNPSANTVLLGNSISRWVVSANTGDFTGAVTGTSANMSTSVNSALLTVGTSFIANTSGVYHTGTVNAASHTVGSNFIANSTQITISGIPLSANGGTGTGGQVLTSNGTTGSPYWSTVSGGGGGSITVADDTSTNGDRYILFANQTSGTMSTSYVSSTALKYNPSSGQLSATLFSSSSDQRLKTNIHDIEDPLGTLNQLRGVSFNRVETGLKDFGVIAQELEEVLPSLVYTDGEGYKSVSYDSIIGFLIEAIKKQQSQIDMLMENKNH